MGKTKTEKTDHGSITGSYGKKSIYKTHPLHQPALRTKISKRRNTFDFSTRRRSSREDGLRGMDLMRGFYALTQTSRITSESPLFRIHTKATVVILITFSIVVTTRQYVGNPIDCIHTRDIPEEVLNTYCWIHSTFTVVDARNRIITDQNHYPGVLFTGDHPIRQVKYYQWVAFVLVLQIPDILDTYVWCLMQSSNINTEPYYRSGLTMSSPP